MRGIRIRYRGDIVFISLKFEKISTPLLLIAFVTPRPFLVLNYTYEGK